MRPLYNIVGVVNLLERLSNAACYNAKSKDEKKKKKERKKKKTKKNKKTVADFASVLQFALI